MRSEDDIRRELDGGDNIFTFEPGAKANGHAKEEAAWTADEEGDGRTVIQLAEGKVNEHARQCARLLDGEMFLRGPNAAVLVRVEEAGKPSDDGFTVGGVRRQKGALIFAAPTTARVQYRLDERVRFQKLDTRSGKWRDKSCPPAFAERIIAAAPELGFRQCAGIVAVPLFVRGEIVAANGYHAGTGVYIDLNGKLPKISERPTKADAEGALNTLLRPFRGYLDGNSGEVLARLRCAITAAALTAVLRPSLDTAPALLLDGNAPGAGKGKMGRALAAIGAGRHPAIITEGHSDEETEKRLTSAILGGAPALLLDNLQRFLATSTLESGLTEPVATIRPFGRIGSDVTVPFSALVIITANNADLRADMLRRTLPVRIIAATEEPELRRFGFDPVEEAKAHRHEIIAAGLTIARAWWHARESKEGERIRQTTLGSFEQWADLVAGAVEWLTGMNPVTLIEERKKQDPRKADERRLIEALAEWQADLRDEHGRLRTWWKAKEAARGIDPELWAAVIRFNGEHPSGKQVGWWLTKKKDAVLGNWTLAGQADRKGVIEWTIRPLPGLPGFAGSPYSQPREFVSGGAGDSFSEATRTDPGKTRQTRHEPTGCGDGDNLGNSTEDRPGAARPDDGSRTGDGTGGNPARTKPGRTRHGPDRAHPSWRDDRGWALVLGKASNVEAKRRVLAEWAAAAGGVVEDDTLRLPAGLPSGLAVAELKRWGGQLGLRCEAMPAGVPGVTA